MLNLACKACLPEGYLPDLTRDGESLSIPTFRHAGSGFGAD
jgi:hypothetical protein